VVREKHRKVIKAKNQFLMSPPKALYAETFLKENLVLLLPQEAIFIALVDFEFLH